MGGLSPSALDYVPDSPDRRNQLPIVPGIDLLPEVVDHDVHDVRAGIEVIPPSILGDQRPAHDAPLMAHEILEDGVLLGGELDELPGSPHLTRVAVELEVGDA